VAHWERHFVHHLFVDSALHILSSAGRAFGPHMGRGFGIKLFGVLFILEAHGSSLSQQVTALSLSRLLDVVLPLFTFLEACSTVLLSSACTLRM
jgi:hypothetical protein